MKRTLQRAVTAVTAVVACLGGLGSAALGGVSLPKLFSDGMVLQRDSEAAVWGWARPGERVVVRGSWGDAAREARADDSGRWDVRLPTPGGGGPFVLTVDGDERVSVRDVMIGDVWLCSGQSNMEWTCAQAGDPLDDLAPAEAGAIRLFAAANTVSAHAMTDVRGRWAGCDRAAAEGFSAVGVAMARELHRALGVPIGVISADWGGTRIEAWMHAEALGAFPAYRDELAYVELMRADPNVRDAALRERGEGWWDRMDRVSGLPKDWAAPAFDDRAWGTMALPATWGGDDLGAFDGVVYFRREVDVPVALAGAAGVLELGPIDDYDDAWVNGVRVGATHADNQWSVARRYAIPAGVLVPGRNVVAVRALDTAGKGGINGQPGQMVLRGSAGGSVPLAGGWRYVRGAGVGQLGPRDSAGGLHQNAPTVLRLGMIAPLAPMTLRGVAWYQGESNRENAGVYEALLRGLIADWRGAFRDEGLPFGVVQIAPYRYPGDRGQAARVREAQLRVSRSVPRTGLVVTTDIGDPSDIHPRNKREVGRRLALWALRDVHGRGDVAASGPVFRSMTVEGSVARLAFDNGAGLRAGPEGLRGFLVAGADRQFRVAQARVEGESVVVSCEGVPRPVAVRYGWDAGMAASLFGGAGLPASPFRTDDWEGDLPRATNDEEVRAYRSTEPGFAELFNGRDLEGWVNVNCGPGTWTVGRDEAGGAVIACSGEPTGVLRTTKMYGNFVLELEYRHHVPGGNAGLFLWSDALPARGQPFTRSVEVQVMDGLEGPGYTSDGDIFPIHGAVMTPENGRGGQRAFPTSRRANPAPLWNHYRVECRDGAVTLSLNGEVVTRGREASPRAGYICLESEGTPVDFRSIRIRELPGSPSPAAAPADGFRALAPGNLDAWDLSPEQAAHWRVRDWLVSYDGGGDHLWTRDEFGDFELICDWRWTEKAVETARPVILPTGEEQRGPDGAPVTARVPDAGDSGIYLRGSDKSQVNIWCWPVGSGEVYGYRTDGSMPAEVRAGVTPRERADAPIGEWNRFEITMRGDRLTVVLNGRTVLDGAQLPGVAPRGRLALQHHGHALEFANIYIRPLR